MKIFVSWSGKRSNLAAKALKELLPDVIQEAEVWMSEHDIQAGARWFPQLSATLAQINVGIACLTPENLTAPWLLFEAGAISKSLQDGKFIPILLDVEPSEVKAPLSQFQTVKADLAGFTRIAESLNLAAQVPLTADRLRRQIERCWPELEKRISVALLSEANPKSIERSDSDILKELLSLARAAARNSQPADVNFPIWIDTRPTRPDTTPFELRVRPAQNVSDFLDSIWFEISSKLEIPAYTYGETWILKNERTGEVFSKMGRSYIMSQGMKRDTRLLSTFDIESDDVLSVLRPKSKADRRMDRKGSGRRPTAEQKILVPDSSGKPRAATPCS